MPSLCVPSGRVPKPAIIFPLAGHRSFTLSTDAAPDDGGGAAIATFCHLTRSEEHTSELQSLMRSSYAVFCLTKKITQQTTLDHISTCTHVTSIWTPQID